MKCSYLKINQTVDSSKKCIQQNYKELQVKEAVLYALAHINAGHYELKLEGKPILNTY